MKVRDLHIVMPMAGNGQRFKDKGYAIPKPLIPINNTTVYEMALSSFGNIEDFVYPCNVNYTFIVRQEFIDDAKIDEQIFEQYPSAHIVSVEKTTNGALETSYLAAPYIKDDECVVLMDCDMYFSSVFYLKVLKDELFSDNPHPCLLTFENDNPRYSYVSIDKNGFANRIVEKQVISNNAILGCYFVGTGKMFKETADNIIYRWYNKEIDSKEIYTSLLYDEFVKTTKVRPVKMGDSDVYLSMGTPEEFEEIKQLLEN